jgi:hypothetical protein
LRNIRDGRVFVRARRAAAAKEAARKPREEFVSDLTKHCGTAALALAFCLTAAAGARAETVALKASLNASEEVPPNASTGTGTLQATYDTVTKQLTYTVDYSGLTGNATMAHFHGPADRGKNAGVVVPVQGSVASPIKGTATLTDEQAAALLDGKWYFNIHTEANKGGEIRGQVTK